MSKSRSSRLSRKSPKPAPHLQPARSSFFLSLGPAFGSDPPDWPSPCNCVGHTANPIGWALTCPALPADNNDDTAKLGLIIGGVTVGALVLMVTAGVMYKFWYQSGSMSRNHLPVSICQSSAFFRTYVYIIRLQQLAAIQPPQPAARCKPRLAYCRFSPLTPPPLALPPPNHPQPLSPCQLTNPCAERAPRPCPPPSLPSEPLPRARPRP